MKIWNIVIFNNGEGDDFYIESYSNKEEAVSKFRENFKTRLKDFICFKDSTSEKWAIKEVELIISLLSNGNCKEINGLKIFYIDINNDEETCCSYSIQDGSDGEYCDILESTINDF